MRPFDKRKRVLPARASLARPPLAHDVNADAEIARDLDLIDLPEKLFDVHAHKVCACDLEMSRTECAPWKPHDSFPATATIFVAILGASRTVKPHREILADLFRAQKLSYETIAKRMGWKSPRSVSHKLRGTRDWATGELQRMCEIAGITMVQLGEMSSDLHLTKTPEAITGARIIDDLPPVEREKALQYLQALRGERRET